MIHDLQSYSSFTIMVHHTVQKFHCNTDFLFNNVSQSDVASCFVVFFKNSTVGEQRSLTSPRFQEYPGIMTLLFPVFDINTVWLFSEHQRQLQAVCLFYYFVPLSALSSLSDVQ